MKILYVKSNSERAKEVQLQTIIFENNGLKYVKKKALCKSAIPHLKKMKSNYDKISSLILTHQIKLAKLIDETDDSLTFEFVDGDSLESQFYCANKYGADKTDEIIDVYMELLKTGFKTTVFASSTMINDEYKCIFGDYDFSELDGQICFDGISNIDLSLSNIIIKDKYLYIIDYEWVFELNIPVNFCLFRNAHKYDDLSVKTHSELFSKMENTFIGETVVKENGFFKVQNKYLNNRLNVIKLSQEKDQQIQHWQDTAQSLRIKNRIIRIVKKITFQSISSFTK